jgi:4-hydroxy 2-oxovalerate aldolase
MMSKVLQLMAATHPIVLDVTIRDGGYLNGWNFTWQEMQLAFETAFDCGADIVEIGYLDDRQGLPVASSWQPEELVKLDPIRSRGLLAAMCRPSVETPIEVLEKRKGLIDLIRIPVDLRNPSLANQLGLNCNKAGIPFSYNLTNISCYSAEQIKNAFTKLSDNAAAVYIADSRGALLPVWINEIFDTLASVRESRFGYHAHDNLSLAIENTAAALSWGVDFIDGSLFGIGLGGRNLDLQDAIHLVKESRPDILHKPMQSSLKEESFGVPGRGNEMPMYRLTGEKNFKMEWAMMMSEKLGQEATCEILQNLPDDPMFLPQELRPHVKEDQWKQLVW